MTISGQSLRASEKKKLNDLRKSLTPEKRQAMDKRLSKIVQDAIREAGAAESKNIKDRIAKKLRGSFPLD
jgi:Spy/CpxP family protein refolding chaperone